MKNLLVLILSAAIVTPAAAANAPAAAPTSGTHISMAALLDSGYELKSTLMISNDDQKVLWPNDPIYPMMMVTLQKGASLAVCSVSTVNMVNMAPSMLAGLCNKR